MLSVCIGIDVACALGKRLPVCVVSKGSTLIPLEIPRHLAMLIPRGVGNKEIGAELPFRKAAQEVVNALNQIVSECQWLVERIAIDAPAAPPAKGARLAENELARLGLSVFRTPEVDAWAGIKSVCVNHMKLGKATAALPHANKIWMLFGFELFSALRSSFAAEVIEVYPFAIARTLASTCRHKSTQEGYLKQLSAVAARTGWSPMALEAALKTTVAGSRHDRLDAFMAAWIATLPLEKRHAIGDAQRADDAIWVPLEH